MFNTDFVTLNSYTWNLLQAHTTTINTALMQATQTAIATGIPSAYPPIQISFSNTQFIPNTASNADVLKLSTVFRNQNMVGLLESLGTHI